MTLADYEEALSVNLRGPLQHAGRHPGNAPARRRAHRQHRFDWRQIASSSTPYTMSKFALVGLSKAMRAELAKDGVVVTTICPGLMRTGSRATPHSKGNTGRIRLVQRQRLIASVQLSAETAARRIISACQRGEAEVIFPVQAKIAAVADAIAPNSSPVCSA